MAGRDRLRYVNFNQLRSFYAVALELNFTKAAEWLSIGQPTVTTQVKDLEEAYDVQLFHRSPQGLELTDTGHALLSLARQKFALEDQAHTLLTSTGNSFAGRLHIGTVGPFFVMDLLSEYSERYPLIKVSVESGNSDAIYQRLLNFEVDVAILGQDYQDHKLEAINLGHHEITIIVNRSHAWSGRNNVDLAELDGQRMIYREEGSMTRRALEEKLEAKNIRPNVVMELARDSVVEAVSAGLGAGIIARDELPETSQLKQLQIRDETPFTHSYAVCLKERLAITPIQVFMNLARNNGKVP
ncbi:MAG: LysR substrate-binding domain-containing protein [Alphaproteobacteria bacterium]|nr:LysR substrate-binding domain-containing protein [Alphaproteobacteria bacterium]